MPDPTEITVVVPMFEGVTTALVVFVFVCVLIPKLVRNKTQFYAAFVCVLLVILIHTLAIMIRDPAFQVFGGAATGVLQIAAIVMLYLCAGGISLRDLGSELAGAYEVIRRGEESKTVIVPIRGEMPKRPGAGGTGAGAGGAAATPSRGSDDEDEVGGAARIDLPAAAGWPTARTEPAARQEPPAARREPPPPAPPPGGPIPLE